MRKIRVAENSKNNKSEDSENSIEDIVDSALKNSISLSCPKIENNNLNNSFPIEIP